jgi:hypothetical protein
MPFKVQISKEAAELGVMPTSFNMGLNFHSVLVQVAHKGQSVRCPQPGFRILRFCQSAREEAIAHKVLRHHLGRVGAILRLPRNSDLLICQDRERQENLEHVVTKGAAIRTRFLEYVKEVNEDFAANRQDRSCGQQDEAKKRYHGVIDRYQQVGWVQFMRKKMGVADNVLIVPGNHIEAETQTRRLQEMKQRAEEKAAAEKKAAEAAASSSTDAESAAQATAEPGAESAEPAAESAAGSSAESAAGSSAESAAGSTAESAEPAAESAAGSTAESAEPAAESAAGSSNWADESETDIVTRNLAHLAALDPENISMDDLAQLTNEDIKACLSSTPLYPEQARTKGQCFAAVSYVIEDGPDMETLVWVHGFFSNMEAAREAVTGEMSTQLYPLAIHVVNMYEWVMPVAMSWNASSSSSRVIGLEESWAGDARLGANRATAKAAAKEKEKLVLQARERRKLSHEAKVTFMNMLDITEDELMLILDTPKYDSDALVAACRTQNIEERRANVRDILAEIRGTMPK